MSNLARWTATAAAALALVSLGLAAGLAAGPPSPTLPDGGVAPVSPNVKIIFQTVPPEKAVVLWAKKPLGVINAKPKRSLTIERPRDSGPLDVVIKAKDYLPVHTRAYTFTDSKVFVKLTPVEEKKSLFGYREEIPDGGLAEAGAAPPLVGPPAPPDGGAR
jgi:hypothetical protein